MRCGIYAEMQTPLDKPHAELTWEIMRQIEHADAVGFDTYSVIEHHFFQQFGISANPLAMFTAAADRTRRIHSVPSVIRCRCTIPCSWQGRLRRQYFHQRPTQMRHRTRPCVAL